MNPTLSPALTSAPIGRLLPLLVLGLASCAGPERQESPTLEGEGAPAAQTAPVEGPRVTLLRPAADDVLEGPSVSVQLGAEGIRIVPAGELIPGTGHHHLYLDEDLGDPAVPVPSIPGRVVHLGTGVSEYTFENVPAGEHRLIAVVADGLHVPIQPWVVDTVRFRVR